MALIDLIRSNVKDTSGKLDDPGDYTSALSGALKRYSKDRPLLMVEDLSGADSYDLPLPGGWCEGFSTIAGIEYPVGNVPATLLDSDLWQLYRSPDGLKLRILHASIDTGETVRVEYTALYGEATIPTADEEAIAALAASLCLRQLAAGYGNTNDSTIQADSVNHQSKTDEYRRLADSFEKLYGDHLGIGANSPIAAAMATVRPADSGRVRLTHGGMR